MLIGQCRDVASRSICLDNDAARLAHYLQYQHSHFCHASLYAVSFRKLRYEHTNDAAEM